jgi:phage terminase small subunit
MTDSPRKPRGLTERQQRFVDEYVVDVNGKQAAIRAGYSHRGAEVTASQLLRNPKVAAAVVEAKRIANEKTSQANAITRERILEETAILAFSDITKFTLTEDGEIGVKPGVSANAVRAISLLEISTITDPGGNVRRNVKIRLWDKPSMVKLGGRHAAVEGYADRVELTGKDGGPVRTEEVTREEAMAALRSALPKTDR